MSTLKKQVRRRTENVQRTRLKAADRQRALSFNGMPVRLKMQHAKILSCGMQAFYNLYSQN